MYANMASQQWRFLPAEGSRELPFAFFSSGMVPRYKMPVVAGVWLVFHCRLAISFRNTISVYSIYLSVIFLATIRKCTKISDINIFLSMANSVFSIY